MTTQKRPKEIRYSTRRMAVALGATHGGVFTAFFVLMILPDAGYGGTFWFLMMMIMSPAFLTIGITSLFCAFCENECNDWDLAAKIVSTVTMVLPMLYFTLWAALSS